MVGFSGVSVGRPVKITRHLVVELWARILGFKVVWGYLNLCCCIN